MTAAQRAQLRRLKSDANQQKSALLRLADAVDRISPREGERLSSIIGRLEHWQNSGAGVGR